MATIKRRIVFVPGIMGSILEDAKLANDQVNAKKMCKDNFGNFYTIYKVLPVKLEPPPCGDNPAIFWGAFEMLHWLAEQNEWWKRLTLFNGIDKSDGVSVPPEGKGLAHLTFSGKAIIPKKIVGVSYPGVKEFKVIHDPYHEFLDALRKYDKNVDLLVFPYDWRLSNAHNANILADKIRKRWWPRNVPEEKASSEESITIIAHSMGGLIARAFIESDMCQGHRFVEQLITVGTPHRGAPEIYTHFHGITKPLEIPFLKKLESFMKEYMNIPLPLDFILPGRQKELIQSFASTIEMLPTYTFIPQQRAEENLKLSTYNGMFHLYKGHSSRPVTKLIADFRRNLVDDNHLDYWLNCHGITYHLLAATNIKTITAYRPENREPVREELGDGTVPFVSAQLNPISYKASHIHPVLLTDGKKEHEMLFHHPRVVEYCIQKIFRRRSTPGVSTPRPLPKGFTHTGTTILQDLAEKIIGARTKQKEVICLIDIFLSDSDRFPPIDYKIISSESRPQKLENKLPGTSTTEVWELNHPTHGKFKYVALDKGGGVLFLHSGCQSSVELITCNTVSLEDYYKSCTNEHHAEVQLVNWILKQPKSWIQRVKSITIINSSLDEKIQGYSPCNICCHSLRWLTDELRRVGADLTILHISWKTLYKGRKDCLHPTDKKNLELLEAKGWTLSGPRPL